MYCRFVLYQMSKNMNKRFFAEFLALLSLKVTYYLRSSVLDFKILLSRSTPTLTPMTMPRLTLSSRSSPTPGSAAAPAPRTFRPSSRMTGE